MDRDSVRLVFEAIMADAGVSDRDVAVVFLSDDAMRVLNRKWRGIDRPTDCISFPSREGEGAEFAGSELGDIFISLETAYRQGVEHAGERMEGDRALHDEVVLLFVHSLLHLLGYDHENEAGTEKMKRMEERLLKAADTATPPYPPRTP